MSAIVPYKAKDYTHLKGLTGITDLQIEEHLKLYNGYVKRTNALLEKFDGMTPELKTEPGFQELKRRLGWEFDGMRLHEYYFDQIKPGGTGPLTNWKSPFTRYLSEHGGVQEWLDDLMSVAKMPGIGWMVAYQDTVNGNMLNMWIEQHEGGHPVGCNPIFIVDCFEHAFTVYLKPTERAKYLGDLIANIDWPVVGDRLILK